MPNLNDNYINRGFHQAELMVKCGFEAHPYNDELFAEWRCFIEMSDMDFVLTRDGYDDIQRELQEILTVKRPQVVERIREARQLGDLSENFDYEDAKRAQAMLDSRIRELKAILSHAKVIEDAISDGSIGIGSRVVVKDLEDGFEDKYIIVGPAESSPADGKISHESCVGAALMGKKVDDVVSVSAPGGVIKYQIVSVS